METANDYLARKVQELENELNIMKFSLAWWKKKATENKSIDERHELEREANENMLFI